MLRIILIRLCYVNVSSEEEYVPATTWFVAWCDTVQHSAQISNVCKKHKRARQHWRGGGAVLVAGINKTFKLQEAIQIAVLSAHCFFIDQQLSLFEHKGEPVVHPFQATTVLIVHDIFVRVVSPGLGLDLCVYHVSAKLFRSQLLRTWFFLFVCIGFGYI
jgi:hypothetical protein